MPYTPDRRQSQDEQHGDGKVGYLQRCPVAKHRHLGTKRDERESGECRNHRNDRRHKIYESIDATGCDALFERQLDAVSQALQGSFWANPVGAGPQLHPAQQLAFGQDRHQHRQHEEHEYRDRFGRHQPPGVVAERGHGRHSLREGPHWYIKIGVSAYWGHLPLAGEHARSRQGETLMSPLRFSRCCRLSPSAVGAPSSPPSSAEATRRGRACR